MLYAAKRASALDRLKFIPMKTSVCLPLATQQYWYVPHRGTSTVFKKLQFNKRLTKVKLEVSIQASEDQLPYSWHQRSDICY